MNKVVGSNVTIILLIVTPRFGTSKSLDVLVKSRYKRSLKKGLWDVLRRDFFIKVIH